MIDITVKIRQVLMNISDDLHKIYEDYKKYLINVETLLTKINQAA